MEAEHCCVCDDATGHAGQADDSIFLDLPDGESHGPLCEECHRQAEPYLERWQMHAAQLQKNIDRLQAVVSKLSKCWRLDEHGNLVQDVPVVPDMDVWTVSPDGGVFRWLVESVSNDGLLRGRFHGASMKCYASQCYRTRKAAEKGEQEEHADAD